MLVEIDKVKVFNHRTKKSYYRRRFACPLEPNDTTHMQTIYADGSHDLEEEPIRAEREVEKYFKQEEKNTDKLRS
ncbi:MAG: hypothetical protein KAR20_25925 [Candidatus Heimdallarchaeota archaeon]|nr:hypothetical protein [Candidatus Heimdallarchaeota archaeon]